MRGPGQSSTQIAHLSQIQSSRICHHRPKIDRPLRIQYFVHILPTLTESYPPKETYPGTGSLSILTKKKKKPTFVFSPILSLLYDTSGGDAELKRRINSILYLALTSHFALLTFAMFVTTQPKLARDKLHKNQHQKNIDRRQINGNISVHLTRG